jgi:hypothetical protein
MGRKALVAKKFAESVWALRRKATLKNQGRSTN